MLAIGIVWQLAYAPYVSDYSRYLPSSTGPRSAFVATYGGLVLSSVVVMILGVLLGAADPTDPLGALQSHLGAVGIVILLAFAFSAAMINAAELYSGVMCALTAVQSSAPKRPMTTRTRIVTTVVCGIIATAGALFGESDFMSMFQAFVTLLLYVLIPWSAINLVDYFIIRKGSYDLEALYDPKGVYGGWNAVGLATYAVGLVVQVPFMVAPIQGVFAESLGMVDIAWVVGFVVSAGLYLLLTRLFPGARRADETTTTASTTEPTR
ncbi:purine-cytosine permease-like protein [Pseudoclavibacter chungangensis]|uniref:purine-cytosine permease family protein n=1 Tax=Pseudoclavibacter chungangensis TaxID=587635 RepID=UPI0015C9B063|nr:cytosine permease [Pseudoclavibacter chungangensis]NYJ67902.1 purine-cytosine permease-like protein [Pseudoclavibacter chungangensis]